MTDLSGKTIDRYQIIEPIGQGGMAFVYRVYDTHLSREVAIKIIRTDLFGPAVLKELLTRFEREAKALAQFDHPHIVHVYDYGEYGDSPYLVMQYLSGGTLESKMGTPFDWQEAVNLILPLVQALDYAHKRDVIHRDIKPANVLLTAEGQPKLTDFGIAKMLQSGPLTAITGTGMTIGTPEYMSPEQAMGDPTDHRCDIYSLGIVFYELITGKKPFESETPMAVIIKHINEPLPSPSALVPDLPEAVEEILFTALAKKPDDRYPDMPTLMGILETLRIDGSASAPRMAAPQLKPEPERDRPAAEAPVKTPAITAGLIDAPTPTASTEIPRPFFLTGKPPWLLLGGLFLVALLVVGVALFQLRFIRVMPDLTGLSSKQAAALLEESGLIGHTTNHTTLLPFGSQKNLVDSVISQDAPAGEKMAAGSIVEYSVMAYITHTPTIPPTIEPPAVLVPVTVTPSATPAIPTDTPTPTDTRIPTEEVFSPPTDTRVPTWSPTPTETRMPTLTPSLSPTNAPWVSTDTRVPTWSPTPTETRVPSPTPSLSATNAP
jgi:eukaryotic-like serine/threonine-protein kinase